VNFKKYIAEFKRRNVFKSAITYLVMAWLIAQVSSIVLPAFDASTYFMKNLDFYIDYRLSNQFCFCLDL
jgi:hypothetical protein